MDKEQVAAVLNEIGTLLEIQGENAFRCRAYYNAARAVEQLETNLDEVVAAGKLEEIPGIGATLRDKITTLVTTGRLPFHEELKKKTPPGLFQMLRVQGLGPKKVKALYEELGIDDLDKLRAACEADQVAGLKGFGAKTQQNILESLKFLAETGQRVRIDQALALATRLVEQIRECPGIVRLEVCGSLRRRKETINDIDILVSADDPGPIMERFVTLPQVVQVTGHGDTKSSVTVANVQSHGRRVLMNADLRIVRDEQFPFALHHFTGSKEHNIALRHRAQQAGIKINEYGITGPKGDFKCKDEADIFRIFGMDYIPPEMRENTGELEAALEHRLPALVTLDDLRGTFHCHTDWSDGSATLEEMALAAKALGFKYLGIADHSQSLTVANGLSPQRVRRQQTEIDALNEKLSGIRIFKGTECDILPDGRLDFDDELLATFDYVVASVHSHFGQSEEEMTRRIVRAVSHPRVTMLGHATGRLLLRREGYRVDLEAVLKAAAEHGTMVEINAHPQRLDLDWLHCKRAKQLGAQLVINPDAHSTSELDLVRYGVEVARRGWLEKKDVFNTKTLAEVTKALAARKKGHGGA
jgi:DNA polymerase (family X)